MTVQEAEVICSKARHIVLMSSAERAVVRLSGWKTMQLGPAAFCAVATPKQVKHANKRMLSDFFIMMSPCLTALWFALLLALN